MKGIFSNRNPVDREGYARRAYTLGRPHIRAYFSLKSKLIDFCNERNAQPHNIERRMNQLTAEHGIQSANDTEGGTRRSAKDVETESNAENQRRKRERKSAKNELIKTLE